MELVSKSHRQAREEFRTQLEQLFKDGPVQSHVRNSLRSLRAALIHLSGCPERDFKEGLTPANALATRAALELIRLELNSVERQVLRAELVHLEQRRARAEAHQLRQREEQGI